MPGRLPLKGVGVLVTRERSQAGVLTRALRAEGARVLECPLIAFSPPRDWSEVDRAIEGLREYDGVLFTSVNAVAFFLGRLEALGLEASRALSSSRVYAVGPATAEALRSRGVPVRPLPDRFQAEGLAALLEGEGVKGKRFLHPRAKKAREILGPFLAERGAELDTVTVYETRSARENEGRLREILEGESLDYLTFTSGSTVRAFVEMAGSGPGREEPWREIPAACIGEITAEAARTRGFHRVLTARPSTVPGLVRAILDHRLGANHEPEGPLQGKSGGKH